MKKTIWIIALTVAAIMMLGGCGKTQKAASFDSLESEGQVELSHATQFTIEKYKGGYALITIADEDRFLLVPENASDPDNLPEDVTLIHGPLSHIYLAASSAMDFFRVLDSLPLVTMTSTQASDWSFPEVRDAIESEDMYYVGKYSAPDYEVIIDENCSLAIESTMIYHSPQIKEKLEAMGIPVLVERSSYETDPLGRMEWIKLYGLLCGKEEEANTFFEEKTKEMESVITQGEASGKTVAFFYINSAGQAVVHKPGDYISKMIGMAGGQYAYDDLKAEDDNALSTMKMDMEAFFDKTRDADILVYNSTIEGDLKDINALIDKKASFKEFKAVKNKDVWCTENNMFQQTTGLSDMVEEMYQIFHDQAGNGENLTFLHKLD